MSLGDCKAPGAVMDGFCVARRVGHGLIFPLGPRAWGHDEVWSTGGKRSMGDVAEGGLRRGPKTSPGRGLGRPSEERWAGGSRERPEGSDRVQRSLATVRAAVGIGSEHASVRLCFAGRGLSGLHVRIAGSAALRAPRKGANAVAKSAGTAVARPSLITAAPAVQLPQFVQIEPVRLCNLRCRMCPIIQFRVDAE
jgi:hypothetical protein